MSKKDVETSNKDIARKVISRKAIYFVPERGEVELDLIGETKQEEEVGDANE